MKNTDRPPIASLACVNYECPSYASLPLGMRIALPRDLDELAEDVLEAEGDDALSASAGQLAEWGGGMRP